MSALPPDGLLTAKQAARLLGVHVNTLKRLVRKGSLPHYRFGERGDIRIKVADLDDWLETRRREARP